MSSVRTLLLQLILFFIPVIRCDAQFSVEKLNDLLAKEKSLTAIQKYIEPEKNSPLFSIIRRKIDMGHDQLVCEITSGKDLYFLLIQQDEKGIYLAALNKIIGGKDNKARNIMLRIDSSSFKNFALRHQSIYQSPISPEMYKMFSMNRYGIYCGYGGGSTAAIKKMRSFVSTGDTISLRSWMRDIDYEKKIIGATGLLILRKKGFILSQTDLSQIQHLKELNLPINFCAGCTIWEPERSSVLLDDREIDDIFEWIKEK